MMGRGALAGAKLASERRKRTLKVKQQKEGLRKARHFVPKPPQIMVIRGRINLLSFPTVFVVVGFCIFAMGVVMSMFAYEYVEISIRNDTNSSSTMDMDASLAFLKDREFLQTFRLIGPLTVGLGVFTMLCGVTALLEDRDRKSKRIIIREPSEEMKPGLLARVGPIPATLSCQYTVPSQEYRPGDMLSPCRVSRFTVGSCPNLRRQPSSPVHLNPLRGYMQSMPVPVPVHDLFRFHPPERVGETLQLA